MRSQLVISVDSLRQPTHRTRATQEALFFLVFCFPPAILHTQQCNPTTSTDGQPANIGEQNPLHSSLGSYPGSDVTQQSSLTCHMHVLFCARYSLPWSQCKKHTQPVSRKSVLISSMTFLTVAVSDALLASARTWIQFVGVRVLVHHHRLCWIMTTGMLTLWLCDCHFMT